MKRKLSLVLNRGGLFLLVPLTLWFVLRGADLARLSAALRSFRAVWLLPAVLCMALFVVCEGCNIDRCLRLAGHPTTWPERLKYACAGFFYSSITPSASGGQPMQLFYMHGDRVPLPDGAAALAAVLMNYQIVTVACSVLGLALRYRAMRGMLGWLALGVALNLGLLGAMLAAALAPGFPRGAERFLRRLLRLFRLRQADQTAAKAADGLTQFGDGMRRLARSRRTILRLLLTTSVQILALHSIPFFVYRGFGLTHAGWPEIFCLQSVLYVSVSALPLPGAMGATEGGFWLLFRTMYPAALLRPAILVTRGVSFYLPLLATGLALAALHLKKRTAAG